MLINDSSNLERRNFFNAVEQNNLTILQALAPEIERAKLTADENDITSEERRMGKPLMPIEFEKLLKKLNPNIHVEFNPHRPNMKVIYFIYPDGKKKYISAFENAPIPEFCVFTYKVEWVVDPSSLNTNFKVDRKDLPTELDEENFNTTRPGLIANKTPWHIKKMGWRTILIRLLYEGITTVGKINEFFAPTNNREWAAKTKQQKVTSRF